MLRRLTLALSAAALSASAAAQVPHTFTAGTPAKASEVNGNFSYVDGRVTALAAELAAGVTVGNTAANPVPVTGTVDVGSLPPVTLGGTPTVNVGTMPAVTLGGTPTVNVGTMPAVSISGTPTVNVSGTPSVNVTGLPALVPLTIVFGGSNTSWSAASVTLPTSAVLETIAVRCHQGNVVQQVGVYGDLSGAAGGSVTPFDGSMTVTRTPSYNLVWPTTLIGNDPVLPPTHVGFPLGTSLTFWVGNGTASGLIDCRGTLILRFTP